MLPVLFLVACIERPATSPAPAPAPEPAPAPAPAPDPEPDPDAALAALSGRKVWMVNASEEACAAARALGLAVTCEPERPGAMRDEIVSWCPEIDKATLEALRSALGVPGFAIRSWADQPAEADSDECGSFAEITVRY